MDNYENQQCYLCGSRNRLLRSGKVRDNITIVPLECCNCGLVYLSSFNHIATGFYEDSLMHKNRPCEHDIIKQISYEDTSRRYKQFITELAQKRVLDVGCGDGQFLALAKTIAKNVKGVEPDKQWGEHYRHLGITVKSSIGDFGQDDIFDTITLFHVLEHIQDPIPFLSHVKRLLPKEGRLIVEVPSADDALLTLYKNKPFSEFTYWSCHLYLYTPATLKLLFEKSGFTLIEMKQFQRYPLSNHLYWLSMGKPKGQTHWKELCRPVLEEAYAETLAAIGKCDTLIGIFQNSFSLNND
jgi:2-polyprenyl-3-methyl-5-hydroxy-6-metoxy-1,4-benzoquinol methylase